MENVYQAPAAELIENTVPFHGSGSIENGIAGHYELSIGAILSEAWDKTKGAKGTIWLAIFFCCLVIVPVSLIVDFALKKIGIQHTPGETHSQLLTYFVVSKLFKMWITLPITAGMFMIGVKIATNAPVQASEVFRYFHKTLPLVAVTLLTYLLVFCGTCLLIIPGIYLLGAYLMTVPLVVEKNLSPWQALEASRKAITHRWFSVVGLYLIMGLILTVSMIPLCIGLIWTLPMMMIVSGIVYRNMFGYEGGVTAQ